jgi:hypothetical protein
MFHIDIEKKVLIHGHLGQYRFAILWLVLLAGIFESIETTFQKLSDIEDARQQNQPKDSEPVLTQVPASSWVARFSSHGFRLDPS